MTDFVVGPPLMRGRQRTPEPGFEEGDLCLRFDPRYGTCLGKLENRHGEPDEGSGWGCSCFQNAPCSYCMSEVPECPICGWRDEEPG